MAQTTTSTGGQPPAGGPGAPAPPGGGGGGNGGAGGGAPPLRSRLANSREVALTTIFLLALTVALLYNITTRWPSCELTEGVNAPACSPSPSATPSNTNANAGGNANAAPGQNANGNANANTNANVNANANANTNANVTAGPPPAPTGPAAGPAAAGQNAAAPFIRSVEPGSGDIRGNKPVTIRGTGLGPDVVVTFDQIEARKSGSATADTMTVWTPRHEEGAVDVTVRRGALQNTLPAGYAYVCPAPKGSGLFFMLIMAGALGGCIHALRSLYWYVGNEELRLPWLPMYYILPFSGAAMAMLFSLLIVAGIVDNNTGRNTSLFIIALAGLVGMFSQQAALKLTDIANATFTKPGPGKDPRPQESLSVGAGGGPSGPAASISPLFGPSEGGTPVTIAHSGFADVRSVTFGGVEATQAVFDTATSNITAVTPPHAPGEVEVVATNAAGKTVKLRYTYTPARGVVPGGGAAAGAKITPPSGPAAGGTPASITGTGFTDVVSVTFGDVSAPGFAFDAASASIKGATPARPAGAGEVDVIVTNAAGRTARTRYKYT